MVRPMRMSDGGTGGIVVCLGVGGLVDLAQLLAFEQDDNGNINPDGIEIWILDARRPYNLANVFGSTTQLGPNGEPGAGTTKGVNEGQVTKTFKAETGGIIIWDDGDIQEDLAAQKLAHFALNRMQNDVSQLGEVDENEADISEDDSDRGSDTSSSHASSARKRKSSELDEEESGSEKENARPIQRRRGNKVRSENPLPATS